MSFNTVLAGLDLGPFCQPVADFARSLAWKLDAKLVYLHSEEDAPLSPGWAELALEAERYRREAAARHADEGRATVAWRTGPPAAALQDEALALGADFVVAGTGAFGNQPFLGATALKMVRSVTLPLCLVPTHDGARTTLSGARILAPVDVASTSLAWLRYVGELARRLETTVALVHVVKPPRFVGMLGPEGAAKAPGLIREMLDGATGALKLRAREAGLEHASMRVLEADDAADAILEEARQLDADLIALPAHQKSPLERLVIGSTTEKLARRSHRPLLIFPAGFGPAGFGPGQVGAATDPRTDEG